MSHLSSEEEHRACGASCVPFLHSFEPVAKLNLATAFVCKSKPTLLLCIAHSEIVTLTALEGLASLQFVAYCFLQSQSSDRISIATDV